MKKTITIFAVTLLMGTLSFAQTVHSFYVQDYSAQGYVPSETITINVGDVVRFFNSTGGTYNFEIEDQNNQPSFVESGIPNGQLIYEVTIDANYPNYNDITISEYIFSPSRYKNVQMNKNTASLKEEETQIAVYPNPAQDIINITSDAPVKSVSITSLDGKQVYTGQQTSTIDISSLQSGVYIVNCTLENNQVVTKRIVKR